MLPSSAPRKPRTLAEKLSAPGGACPIPFTHDRLDEVHHWWHELATWYHEPPVPVSTWGVRPSCAQRNANVAEGKIGLP
jgi:hypothetical protein